MGKVRPSPSADKYVLEKLGANLYAARTWRGESCLVALLSDVPAAQSVVYQGLTFDLHPVAEIQVGAKLGEGAIGVVRCTDPRLERNFHALVADAVSIARANASRFTTGRGFDDFVTEWADLFGSVRALSRDESLGLWGELEILASVGNADRAVEVWHGPDAGVFDFAANSVCLEVKTSVAGHRHDFSLLQVVPPSEATDVVIASLRVRSDPADGRTVDDQVARVRAALSSGGLLDRKLSRLGHIPGTDPERYSVVDRSVVEASLVPQPRDVDQGVTGVRFSADVSMVPSISPAKVKSIFARLRTPVGPRRGAASRGRMR